MQALHPLPPPLRYPPMTKPAKPTWDSNTMTTLLSVTSLPAALSDFVPKRY